MTKEYYYTYQGESFGVDEPSFDCIYESLADSCQDDVEEAIAGIPSRSQPCGFGIPYEKLNETKDVLKARFSNESINVYHVSDEKHPVKTYSLADIYIRYFENREECEMGSVDGACLALDMMANFLNQGKWHFGLIDAGGCILSDPNMWPQYPKQNDGTIIWKKGNEEYQPIIWFGLEGEKPIECWTLYERANITNKKVYQGSFGKEIDQEDWKHFWFCEFWRMDWNVLWKHDEGAIIWAFCEQCMDEPEEELEKVKEVCPIELSQDDSTETMLKKVRDYCYHEQKVAVLKKAIYEAGYNIGEAFFDCNCQDEEQDDDENYLTDGRPNPNWLYDAFVDQASESLNGDAQADDVEIDDGYFGEEWDGPYGAGNHWNVIERYDDEFDVYELIYKGWTAFLDKEYGKDWEIRYKVH